MYWCQGNKQFLSLLDKVVSSIFLKFSFFEKGANFVAFSEKRNFQLVALLQISFWLPKITLLRNKLCLVLKIH